MPFQKAVEFGDGDVEGADGGAKRRRKMCVKPLNPAVAL